MKTSAIVLKGGYHPTSFVIKKLPFLAGQNRARIEERLNKMKQTSNNH